MSPLAARLGRLALAGTVLAAAVLAGLVPARTAAKRARTKSPNFVFVITDDQTLGQYRNRVMPNVSNIIGNHGDTFPEAVTQALCCPSRAGLITGQYPHNNGVLSNHPGYPNLVGKDNTLPVWLRRAGYRTGLIGKFLNGYVESEGTAPAPGFSYWFNLLNANYYGASISDNGEQIQLGDSGASNYVDNVFTRHAIRFVRSGGRRPFFLWLSYFAPHGAHGPHPAECPRADPVPAPRDVGSFSKARLPKPPSFDEADVSDKPPFIQGLDPIRRKQEAAMTRHWRCALESLGAVDRGVQKLERTLERTGRLRDTVLVFISDNGYFYGEHRLRHGKGLPYEEGVRVPLAIRIPKPLRDGAPAGRTINLPVGNVDLAPTLLDLAGASSCRAPGDCRVMDGRSLVPLLRGHGGAWPRHRGMLLELVHHGSGGFPCEFQSIRMPTEAYSEYPRIRDADTRQCVGSDEAELYDLRADPFELDNLLFTDPGGSAALRAELEARLDALRDCAGIAGRDPLPPSGHYCE